MKDEAKKRIEIVKVRLLREKTILSADRAINSPHKAAKLIRDYLDDPDREHFVLLCLDAKMQPTHIETVHIGSINAAIVTPREVFKTAILANTATIMVAHNHCSDVLDPSRQDLDMTKRLFEAGAVLGIPLTDHLIIGTEDAYSIRSHYPGLFQSGEEERIAEFTNF